MQHWWQVLISVVAAVLVLWLVLILLLWKAKPDEVSVRAASRLLPDTPCDSSAGLALTDRCPSRCDCSSGS